MTAAEFKAIPTLDAGWNTLLKALWLDGQGDWDQAHQLVDHLGGSDAAWIHAYLHRKEGDQWNADYWYRRAGKTRPTVSLDEEWSQLVQIFWNLA